MTIFSNAMITWFSWLHHFCFTFTEQVFFRAGVLGTLEEIRDDRIMKLLSWLQAWIRGWASRKYYSKMQKQRTALIVMQRNLRKFKIMRSWLWYELWIKLKPRLKATRGEEELEKLEATAVKAEEEYEKVVKVREELEAQNALLLQERNELLAAVDSTKGGMSEYLDKQAKLLAQKAELEGQLNVSITVIQTFSPNYRTAFFCLPLVSEYFLSFLF